MRVEDFKDIKYEKNEKTGIVTLTLNCPYRKNALSFYSFFEIGIAIDALEQDESAGAMIITGAIDPENHDPQKEAFSSGGYFNADAHKDVPEEIMQQIDLTDIAQKKMTLKMFNCNKPIIAAINGFAIGGAFTMTLSGADLIYASEFAWFKLPFLELGITAELASSFLLPRLIGLQKTKEIIYFSQKISALEAQELGIVNKVLPHDQLLDYVKEQTLRLVAPGGPAFAIKKMKKVLHQPYVDILSETLDRENQALNECFQSADFGEALMARMEKRTPVFKGS